MNKLLGFASVLAMAASGVASSQLLFHDGSIQTRAAPVRANVVHVAASGSAADNGARLSAAIAAIADASASNPYVVQLDPGEYDAGASALNLKSFVSVNGAGTWSTTLNSAATVVVVGADDASIRDLTVLSSAPSGVGFILFGDDGASDVSGLLERVRIVMDNASGTSVGVQISNGCLVKFIDCEITGTPLPAFAARTGIFLQGGASARSQCEFRQSRIDLSATGSSSIRAISVLARGDATLSDSNAQTLGGSLTSTLFVAADATLIARQSEIASTDTSVSNSGIYDAFSTKHSGALPVEDLPFGGGDTAYTRYNQCAQNGAEL